MRPPRMPHEVWSELMEVEDSISHLRKRAYGLQWEYQHSIDIFGMLYHATDADVTYHKISKLAYRENMMIFVRRERIPIKQSAMQRER